MVLRRQQQILLVEDDEDALGATTAMLERLGYGVEGTKLSLEALRIFSEEPQRFDLALLDHGMPDLAGTQLAWHLRRIRPGLPVVLYTGYLDTPSGEQLEAAIGGRILFKPATLGELADVIREALGEWAKSNPGHGPSAIP
jgi:DNA-binding NtrC family response regulator